MIMFLLRTVFWLSLIVLVLPIDKQEIDPSITQSISTNSVLKIAGSAVSDISQICSRRPDFCEESQEALMALGVKAYYLSNIALDYLNERNSSQVEDFKQDNQLDDIEGQNT